MLIIRPKETFESIQRRIKEFCDSNELILDYEEVKNIVTEAVKMYMSGEVDGFYSEKIRATKIEKVEQEDYLPASIAGIYAGPYREVYEVETEVEVWVTARTNEDGIEIEVEEW